MALNGKHVIVTSGGTREHVDDVRVMTNISSGALGAKIAAELYRNGAKVHYIHGKGSVMPVIDEGISETARLNTYPIVTCLHLYETLKSLCIAFKPFSVIHSAAVSDFTFKSDKPVKLSSSDEEGFIEYMRQTITRNPKIIQEIHQWAPDTKLIGFKFTVGKTTEELENIAWEMGKKSGCYGVVANDKEMMKREKTHIAYWIPTHADKFSRVYWHGKDAIAVQISKVLSLI
jgi:phosphopantothenoylcysteine synthetase/decarboxylase